MYKGTLKKCHPPTGNAHLGLPSAIWEVTRSKTFRFMTSLNNAINYISTQDFIYLISINIIEKQISHDARLCATLLAPPRVDDWRVYICYICYQLNEISEN